MEKTPLTTILMITAAFDYGDKVLITPRRVAEMIEHAAKGGPLSHGIDDDDITEALTALTEFEPRLAGSKTTWGPMAQEAYGRLYDTARLAAESSATTVTLARAGANMEMVKTGTG